MHSSKLFDYWMKIHNSYDITNEKPMDEAIIEFQPFVDKDPIGKCGILLNASQYRKIENPNNKK